MIDGDKAEFADLVADVYAFYRQDVSEFFLGVWWEAMRPYELAAIRKAFGQHAVNPDTGHFLPKPGDVVKMLGGSTLDSALVAWTKLSGAVERLGLYHTVAFDDPLIHRVVEEMGGWIVLGKCALKDWPFRQNEFVTRYRSYKMRGDTPAYPPRLVGLIDGENASKGYPEGPTILVGDCEVARRVMLGGSAVQRLAFTPLPVAEAAALLAPTAKMLAKKAAP